MLATPTLHCDLEAIKPFPDDYYFVSPMFYRYILILIFGVYIIYSAKNIDDVAKRFADIYGTGHSEEISSQRFLFKLL